jgi:hypothetical protein
MPNNNAAASPKRAPCRFEELMGWQLTEDNRKVQRMRHHRRSGQAPLCEKEGESKWRDAARRETGAGVSFPPSPLGIKPCPSPNYLPAPRRSPMLTTTHYDLIIIGTGPGVGTLA